MAPHFNQNKNLLKNNKRNKRNKRKRKRIPCSQSKKPPIKRKKENAKSLTMRNFSNHNRKEKGKQKYKTCSLFGRNLENDFINFVILFNPIT
jgi:hypothetical protein